MLKRLESSGSPLTRNEEVLGMLFGLWAIIGLFLDGWAHSHQKPDSFFTPWHAVLYSGFTSAGAWALWTVWRRRTDSRSLMESAPPGHLATLAGFAVFGAGAVGDLLWHELLGVEVSTEALLSPTHLVLLLGGTIALSAPLRRALRSTGTEMTWRGFLPPLLSLTLLTSLGAFFLGYMSPFGSTVVAFPTVTTHTHNFSDLSPAAANQLRENWALGTFLITSAVLVFPALFAARRWKTPPGAFLFLYTFLFLLQVGLDEFEQWPMIAVGIAVGVVADTSIRRDFPAWLLGALIPLAGWSTYFLMFELQTGVGWSPELWGGVTLLSSGAGALLGLLSAPVGADPGRAKLA